MLRPLTRPGHSNRPAATGDRRMEGPYRRARLIAWLGVIGIHPLTSPATKWRTVLSVGVLQGDLAIAKGEKVTTVNFDACAVGTCSRECPLRHSTVASDEMTCVAPV